MVTIDKPENNLIISERIDVGTNILANNNIIKTYLHSAITI